MVVLKKNGWIKRKCLKMIDQLKMIGVKKNGWIKNNGS